MNRTKISEFGADRALKFFPFNIYWLPVIAPKLGEPTIKFVTICLAGDSEDVVTVDPF